MINDPDFRDTIAWLIFSRGIMVKEFAREFRLTRKLYIDLRGMEKIFPTN